MKSLLFALLLIPFTTLGQMEKVDYTQEVGSAKVPVKGFQSKKDYTHLNDGVYQIENGTFHAYEMQYAEGSGCISLSHHEASLADLNLKKAEITDLGEYGFSLKVPVKGNKDKVKATLCTPFFPENVEYHWFISLKCESRANASKVLQELEAAAQ
jgi:hypothetical protein